MCNSKNTLNTLVVLIAALSAGMALANDVPAPGAVDLVATSNSSAGQSGQGCMYEYYTIGEPPAPAHPGDQMVFKAHVDNIGTCDLTNIRITDTLPKYVTLVSMSPEATQLTDTGLVWDHVALKAGEKGVFEVTVKFPSGTLDKAVQLTNKDCAYSPTIGKTICGTASSWVSGSGGDSTLPIPTGTALPGPVPTGGLDPSHATHTQVPDVVAPAGVHS